MPIALHYYKIDKDRKVRVRHTFYAETEEEADTLMLEHADGCAAFGPAVKANDVVEIVEDIDEDELPNADDLEAIADSEDEDDEDDPETGEDEDAEEVEEET